MKHLTKLFRATIAIAIMLCVALPTFAHDFEVNGIYYKITDSTNKTVEVTYKGSNYYSYSNEYTGALSIPSSVTYYSTTYSVTSIGSEAFRGCTSLNSITIPNSVTSTGFDAFYDTGWYNNHPDGILYLDNCCLGYKGNEPTGTLSIKEGTRLIGNYAFDRCTGLTSVTIPNSVTSIGYGAFCECTGLTSVTIPNSVTSIGSHAFSYCTGLTSVTIPNSVTSIGDVAFSGCTGLTSVTIPNSVTSIGWSAFSGCSGLTSVTIPNSVTSIGWSAFSGCTGLTSVTIPNSVTSIGFNPFYNTGWYNNQPDGVLYLDNCCLGYKGNEPTGTLSIKEGTRLIGEWTFYNCSGLTSVTIPNSVTSIGNYAFYNCSGLTSVTIPNSVTSIGDDAFYNTGWYNNQPDGILYLDNCCLGYKGNKPTGTLLIKEGTRLIVPEAFYGCSDLTSVTIPNSVTSIGSAAFYNCSGLTSVTIGNSVTTIGDDAFSGCSGLTELFIADGEKSISGLSFPNSPIETLYLGRNTSDAFMKYKTSLKKLTIGNSVTSIGSEAFYNCSGLTEVTISNSVTSIGDGAFRGCSGLISITIPNSVTSIGPDAFSGCTGLTEVTIPNSVTSISDGAFRGCSGLISITIPNSVTSIGPDAFSGCTGLTSVTIPNSVTTIGEWTFNNCTGLTEVTIPNSVTSIGDGAFRGCSGLISITIPNSVISIGPDAFSGCTGLTSVTIPNSVTSIGDGAFYNCSGLISITIPNSVTLIGKSAFFGCYDLTEVNITDLSAWCKIDFGDSNANPLYFANKLKLNGVEIRDLVIPNEIAEIKDYAFYGCSGLTSVIIPNSVTSIGEDAFYDCYDLETIVSLNSTPPTCVSSDSFHYYNYSWATLYVPKDSYAKYFIDKVWGMFSNIKKIEILATSITLDKSSITLDKWATETIKATIAPSNASVSVLAWTSDNPTVATVDQSGKITTINAGTANITAMALDGSNLSASCKVTVNAGETQIVLSQTEASLPVNDIMTLTYTITNSSNKTATWSTSNANVAHVKTNSDGSATIVGVADGVATITATANDGSGASASCVVTVGVGGIEGVETDDNAVEVARYDIHGRLLSEPARGINIIKMSDGTTRKEIVK